MSVLKFHSHPDGELMQRFPREEVRFDRGRRLKSGGVLSGALHTLGYYSTDVCLGSPGRSFDLIIDTGSSITAVPCSTCKQCGPHHCGKTAGCFDPVRSPSAQHINCRRLPPNFSGSCEKCSTTLDRCFYSVHYTEGSSIQGHVVTDLAHFKRTFAEFGSSDGASGDSGDSGGESSRALSSSPRVLPMSARVFFGCQSSETGMFYRQEADGIMGMQPPRARARVPSILSSLVQQQRTAHDSFSLCLSDKTGLFLLGGRPNRERLRAKGALTLPMERGARARYTLALTDVRLSGARAGNRTFRSLGLPLSTYAPTLVDSGTTFVYASTPLYRAIHAHLKQHTPSLQQERGKVCAYLTSEQIAGMPAMQFVFAGAPRQPLLIRPEQYMVEFPKSPLQRLGLGTGKHYCVAVFDNQRGGTVIGASIMRQREVVFDIASSSITFVDADCERITAATSFLEGAFSFAPCPNGNGHHVNANPVGGLRRSPPPPRGVNGSSAASPWLHVRGVASTMAERVGAGRAAASADRRSTLRSGSRGGMARSRRPGAHHRAASAGGDA